MNPQGSSLIDTDYFDKLIAQVDKVASLADLNALTARILPSIEAQTDAITAELAVLTPALGLLTLNPASLPSVITFISDFVTHVLTPQLKPTITYAAQQTATIAKLAELTAAIAAATARVTP
jgi:hypothetical protein